MEKNQKIYFGLDIGTDSVGFAATDGDYNILKSRGKNLIGVRLFDEGQVAKERRVFRANKVRRNREKMRLRLLQELFADSITCIDPLFFNRIDASALWNDDKKKMHDGLNTLDSIFADLDFNDKQYHKKFKSIYHLRNACMQEDNYKNGMIRDIRLVYLACHHILKNRGHFLYDSQDFSIGSDEYKFNIIEAGQSSFVSLNVFLSQRCEENNDTNVQFDMSKFDLVAEIAKRKDLGMKAFYNEIGKLNCFNLPEKHFDKKFYDSILKAISGYSIVVSDLISDYEDEEIKKFSFREKYEEIEPLLKSKLEDKYELIDILKQIYNWIMVAKLLQGNSNISEATIGKYEKHKNDLRKLKDFVKQNCKDKYYKIFRSTRELRNGSKFEKGNYVNYIGSNLNKGKQIVKKVEKAGFYNFLKSEFSEFENCPIWKEIKEINDETFMPKLRTGDNSIILINYIDKN